MTSIRHENENKKALIAMSGGVDSSVAALLAKSRGCECVGCTMKLYANEDAGLPLGRTCCSLDDVEDARSVAYRLGMPYYVFNFTDDFREKVIQKFIRCYEAGATPNPCIDCNRYMKFEKLYERAGILGCGYVVTGHYARIESDGSRYLLKKALDETKDQSYVLYSMTQEQLAHTLFPLGSLKKTEVRRIAEENGFVNAKKPDSQDICFVPDGDYAAFLERYTGKTYPHGDFISPEGRVLGEHKGIVRYTLGQRRNLGVSSDAPLYVTAIDIPNNTVTLSHGEGLYADTLIAEDINLISVPSIAGPMRVKAKIRYRQAEQPATVIQSGGVLRITFDEPQRAPTPGQAVVLYDGDTVVGGGTISRVVR